MLQEKRILAHLVMSTKEGCIISKADARVGLEHTCGRLVNKKEYDGRGELRRQDRDVSNA
jgi:hypothetical protein